jgi:hypothetical protein
LINYLPLNLPVDITIDFPEVDSSTNQKMHFDAARLIPVSLRDYLTNELNLKISTVLLFQQLPNTECNIHFDGVDGVKARPAALNFIKSEPDTSMVWYDVLSPCKVYNVFPGNMVISHYEEEQVKEIDRAMLQGFNIVRVDVPHKVINNSDKIRWCLSIRFDKLNSFEEIYNIFKHFERT